MAAPAKDTVYIEADDEITLVIDKVLSAKTKVVAVVLPKRATVFQSAVNMKLLKKSADEAHKSLVLISSEGVIKSMAAIAGLHIAKTLNSKPEIPKKIAINDSTATIFPEELEVDTPAEEPKKIIEKKAIKTEPQPQTEKKPESSDDSGTIELDNSDPVVEKPEARVGKAKKQKKIKVPDFTSFKFKLGIGLTVLTLFIVGWLLGFVILPKATVTINTDVSRIDVSSEFTASSVVDSTDIAGGVLKAIKADTKNEDSVTVKATGELDKGEKATGTMTITNCKKSNSGVTVPAGSIFISGGIAFETVSSLGLGPAVFVGDECISDDFPAFGAVKDVGVVATKAGEDHNVAPQSYTTDTTSLFAFGSIMSGGTTEIVVVVSQADIDSAENQLAGSATAAAISELKATLEGQQVFHLSETLVESVPLTIRSAEVGAEATDLTVTRTVTYTMLGVSSTDVSAVLESAIAEGLNETQNIRSDGFDTAQYSLKERSAEDAYSLGIKTVATIGPEIDETLIKQQVAGLKRGDIENLLESRDGVESVIVEYSPFWIFSTPDKPEKIEIVVVNEES